MRQLQGVLKLALLAAGFMAAQPAAVWGQQQESEFERAARLARRGAGLRVGVWNVDAAAARQMARSPTIEGYFQRGLDRHLVLENSVGVWRATTTRTQVPPLGGPREVETKSYVVPLLTSLKLYPITGPGARIEPYLLAGVGFALGVQDEGDNAIGSSGTSLVTGLGFRAGAGLEVQLSKAFGVAAAGKYQWIRYSETLGGMERFAGLGAEGGITYRFQY